MNGKFLSLLNSVGVHYERCMIDALNAELKLDSDGYLYCYRPIAYDGGRQHSDYGVITISERMVFDENADALFAALDFRKDDVDSEADRELDSIIMLGRGEPSPDTLIRKSGDCREVRLSRYCGVEHGFLCQFWYGIRLSRARLLVRSAMVAGEMLRAGFESKYEGLATYDEAIDMLRGVDNLDLETSFVTNDGSATMSYFGACSGYDKKIDSCWVLHRTPNGTCELYLIGNKPIARAYGLDHNESLGWVVGVMSGYDVHVRAYHECDRKTPTRLLP